jgi:hypothetical protein
VTIVVTVLAMAAQEYEFETLGGKPWAQVLNGLRKDTWHRVHSDRLTREVLVRLGNARGQLVCTGVMIGATTDVEVTSRSLREVPLGDVMGAMAAFVSGTGDFYDSELHRAISRHYAKQGLVETAAPTTARPARPGPTGWRDEHYQEVADHYRTALQVAPRAPVRYVRQQMQTSEPTARRWIKTARDKGMLGASVPGKAGEQGR